MTFREVSVVQIKEALRRWLKGEGERPIAHGIGIDRKTARRQGATSQLRSSSALTAQVARSSSPTS